MSTIRDAHTHVSQIVNSKGQALVQAESHAEARQHSGLGDAYLIKTGFIASSATADQTTAMLYVKNTSTTKNIFLGHLRTCGELAFKWILKKGATAMSAETAVVPVNMMLGSPKVLVATVNIGAQDATVTGGTEIATWINSIGHSNPDLRGSLILLPNQAITLEVLPFANASGEACITIECWQTDPE